MWIGNQTTMLGIVAHNQLDIIAKFQHSSIISTFGGG